MLLLVETVWVKSPVFTNRDRLGWWPY